MSYLLVNVTGDGTHDNPFRPDLPANVAILPGLKWSAHIPCDTNGIPLFGNCYIWIPNTIVLPGGTTIIDIATARSDILSRDPLITLTGIEMTR